MAPSWLKMYRNRRKSWLSFLYQSPVDVNLVQDRKRLATSVQTLVTAQLSDKEGERSQFDELERTTSLLNRIRLFLHLYLSIGGSHKKEHKDAALNMLESLNAERTQLQALSIWSVSSRADAPAEWKSAQRRRGVSSMPWRSAVSYAEHDRYASDRHWMMQYHYDQRLSVAAREHGGMSQLTSGLRALDADVRLAAAESMCAWLNTMGDEGEAIFRRQAKLATQQRFNFAKIDASERALEMARRVAMERAPELSRNYFAMIGSRNDKPAWHDRYAVNARSGEDVTWRVARGHIESLLARLGPVAVKTGQRVIESSHLIQPKGRGGGFTTPVFFNRKGKVDAGPFVYAPFDGSFESLRTLAHEMGHAVHACLSAPRGAMLCDAGWAVAETAAFICEQLLLEDDQRARADQDFAMLVHQPSIAMFERELGDSEKEPADQVWLRALTAHYGHGVSLDGYSAFWRRHSSSISAIGYPMAYLLGWALASRVCDNLTVDETATRANIITMFKQGGAVGFDDAAALFGADDIHALMHAAYDKAEIRLAKMQGKRKERFDGDRQSSKRTGYAAAQS